MNIGVLAVAAVLSQPFNSDFYLAIATVAPIFLLALIVQLRVLDPERLGHLLTEGRQAGRPFRWIARIFVVDLVLVTLQAICAEGFALNALNAKHADAIAAIVCRSATWDLPTGLVLAASIFRILRDD